MRTLPVLRLGFVLAVVLVGGACSDDDKNTKSEPGSLLPDEQVDSGVPGAPADAGVAEVPKTDGATAAPLAACVDRPFDLPRPTTELPCELLPPGFSR